MHDINIINVCAGCYWLEIPEENFSIICGCPDGFIKHVQKQGLIHDMPDGFKSGPNAILLNEVSIERPERFNLSEFAVLHMIYRQSKNGIPPLIIGTEQQLKEQFNYLLYGNFGFVHKEDYIKLGFTEEEGRAFIAIKRYFAGNAFGNLNQLVDSKVLEKEEIEIYPNIFVERMGNNLFYFRYKDTVKLINLAYLNEEAYCPPYTLPNVVIPKAEFAITHIGEGDGWNENLPCMSSLVQCNGYNYVLDMGPYMNHTLQAVNKKIEDITGFFLSHIHDDHCSSIVRYIYNNKPIRIYSVRTVYASLISKLSSLINIPEKELRTQLDFCELQMNEWNEINGMQVKPVFSFHPVDTVLYIFSYTKNQETKTYAHLADIASLAVLQAIEASMEDDIKPIVTALMAQTLVVYKEAYNLKKPDVGGPTVHGNYQDFIDDKSEKLVFSHTTKELTEEQLKYARQAVFGETDILLP